MSVREMLRILHDDGWYIHEQNGSHIQLKHPAKKGKVTVARHSKTDLKTGTVDSIFTQAGLK